MSQNNHEKNDEDYLPKSKAEVEGEEFEDKYDHTRGGKKKSIEKASYQSKPKSVR